MNKFIDLVYQDIALNQIAVEPQVIVTIDGNIDDCILFVNTISVLPLP